LRIFHLDLRVLPKPEFCTASDDGSANDEQRVYFGKTCRFGLELFSRARESRNAKDFLQTSKTSIATDRTVARESDS